MKKKYLYPFIVLIFLYYSPSGFAEIVVITNPSSGIESISQEELKEIYLRRKRKTIYGKRVNPVDMEDDIEIRDHFYSSITGRTTRQMDRHWSALLFAGEGSPPRMLPSQQAVVTYVANTKDAIGFVERTNVTGQVKIIFILN
ncbi:MAG TPA: hypothetical protein DCZ03_01070 [Gammaproteobacteria bacterium]|nr:hypothetical protein [Gammaproteobacteria bacterium]